MLTPENLGNQKQFILMLNTSILKVTDMQLLPSKRLSTVVNNSLGAIMPPPPPRQIGLTSGRWGKQWLTWKCGIEGGTRPVSIYSLFLYQFDTQSSSVWCVDLWNMTVISIDCYIIRG